MNNDLKEKRLAICEQCLLYKIDEFYGPVCNKSKYIRLDWSSLLLHAFENIDVLKPEQQHKIELLYNKLSTIWVS